MRLASLVAVCWQIFIAQVTTYYETNYYGAGAVYDASVDTYRCLNVENDDVDNWNKDSSPWSVPQDCIWPLDESDTRVCSLENTGMHNCGAQIQNYPFRAPNANGTYEPAYAPYGATCGSDFDMHGNSRFISSMLPYRSIDRMVDGEFSEDLSFGYTSYDNFFLAFTATFQACSMEGWTGIMYQTMDAWSVVPSVLIFVLLVLVGGNIVLNLVLAVVSSSLDALDEEEEEEVEEEEAEEKEGKEKEEEEIKYTGLKGFVKNPLFGQAIMFCILLNTIVLACDGVWVYDPANKDMVNALEVINEILTFIFLIEMILNIAGLGAKEVRACEERKGSSLLPTLPPFLMSLPFFFVFSSLAVLLRRLLVLRCRHCHHLHG